MMMRRAVVLFSLATALAQQRQSSTAVSSTLGDSRDRRWETAVGTMLPNGRQEGLAMELSTQLSLPVLVASVDVLALHALLGHAVAIRNVGAVGAVVRMVVVGLALVDAVGMDVYCRGW